ncbi:MAG: [FeFe] hydrogenase H-cluster maturation GTPase HydF [Firmicutes bacterium]|nr:[FeFe] hydrogenase H-cluster maturation GTPase HydF [Bacillota bacterium]
METNTLNQTPRSGRLHIGVYGRRNAGKSSLINALAGHQVAVVADVAGTTTDPVYKSMEIHGLGPCVLIDTAGYDDEGELGKLRVEKTVQAAAATDVAIVLFAAALSPEDDFAMERRWIDDFKKRQTPVLALISQSDTVDSTEALAAAIEEKCGLRPLAVSVHQPGVREILRVQLLRLLPEGREKASLAGHLIQPGDVVLLVMPQDIQAPEGRLILPQVQTIRDLLDHHGVAISATVQEMPAALAALRQPPALIITDSQAFHQVYAMKPAESRLTSFSVLLAAVKGDIATLIQGAEAVDGLTEQSHILIAEACTHAPLSEDIGREKIPRLLRKRLGQGLRIDMVSGTDFPEDLRPYDLIVHCGACMFNRKYMMHRVAAAVEAGTPITNYGLLLAKLNGILDKIDY